MSMIRSMPPSTGRHMRGSRGATEGTLLDDWTYVSPQWTADWLARATELVEKYKPEIVYFDWWIGQPSFRSSVTEFDAFYYNFAKASGYTGVVNFKDFSMDWKSGVRDFERGQLDKIEPDHWQTDTSISKLSWGYIENDQYQPPDFLLHQLIDIVSKNGNLLLNIGPKPDGTIPAPIITTLKEMGVWLKANGEAIYATTPWKIYGEGPTQGHRRSLSRPGYQAVHGRRFSLHAKGRSSLRNRDGLSRQLFSGNSNDPRSRLSRRGQRQYDQISGTCRQ